MRVWGGSGPPSLLKQIGQMAVGYGYLRALGLWGFGIRG